MLQTSILFIITLLLAMLSILFHSDWYKKKAEKRRMRKHNNALLTDDAKVLINACINNGGDIIFSKGLMEDAYLSSISWDEKLSDTSKLNERARNELRDCPICGCKAKDLKWVELRSPDWTWDKLCGRQGYLSICPNCKKQVGFILTYMN